MTQDPSPLYAQFKDEIERVSLQDGHKTISAMMTFSHWLLILDGLILLASQPRLESLAKANTIVLIKKIMGVLTQISPDFATLIREAADKVEEVN